MDAKLENHGHPKIIVREKKMVEAMVHIYCRSHHGTGDLLCSRCGEIMSYTKRRLDNCRYQEKKSVCGMCGLKCYSTEFRDDTERIFTYAGPKMFFKHPLLGLRHILDALWQ